MGIDPSMTANWEQLNRDVAERRAFKQLKLKLHPQHLGHDMYFEVSGHPVFERGEFRWLSRPCMGCDRARVADRKDYGQ